MIIRFARAFFLLIGLALPALAQDAAAPESTEPPVPRAAPLKPVMEETLPRAGGILVFGGTRGVGLEVVKELVQRGEKVTAMARAGSDTAALQALKISLVAGDALSPEDVKQAFASAPFRAVVSTVGGHGGDYRVDVEGNHNITDAAKAAGIPRMVLVTAIGAGDSAKAAPWYISLVMKDYYKAKTTAEDYLRASGIEYVIVRPGWLLDRPATTKAALTADHSQFSWITRADLGKLIAESLRTDANVNKVMTAFDSSLDRWWKVVF